MDANSRVSGLGGDEANNINGRGQEITEQQGLTRRKNCSHEGVQAQCGRIA